MDFKRFVVISDLIKSSNGSTTSDLATEAHITKSVIGVFFWKNVIRFAFCCFQNVVF